MPHWLLKSALHRLIAASPWPVWLNEQFQERVTGSIAIGAEQLAARLAQGRTFLDHLFRLCPPALGGFRALELGTGWYPFLPLGLYLCGAEGVWTFDIQRLLKPKRMELLLTLFEELAARGELLRLLPWARAERIERLLAAKSDAGRMPPAELLARFNIHARVGDVRQNGLPAHSLDLVCSYSVLEYIPREPLVALHTEFARVAAPGAVAVHLLHLDDEYSKFDRRLSPYHFLRYTERQWRWLNSALNPLSRLRISDHRAALVAGGWEIEWEKSTGGEASALDAVPLAPEFHGYAREDLAVLRSWVVAQRR